MAQLRSCLHLTFKELSNDISHTKIQVKIKKLWPQQVEEAKQAVEKELCRDISRLCHNKASDKARNFVEKNPNYVTKMS